MKVNWKRYTIRSLLIAMTVIAIPLAYISTVVSSLRPLSRDFASIVWDHGAAFRSRPIEHHRWLHPFLPIAYTSTIETVVLFEDKHDGETLVTLVPHMNAFDAFRQLSIQNSAITDDDLVALGRLDNLKMLELKGSNFTDASLAHIATLKHLEQLDISKTRITVNGLKQLREALPSCCIVADVPVPPVQIKPAMKR